VKSHYPTDVPSSCVLIPSRTVVSVCGETTMSISSPTTRVTRQPPPVFLSRTPNALSVRPRRIKQRETHTTREFSFAVTESVDQRTDRLSSVFNTKRLIGRKFSDPEVQSDIKQFPFKVFDKGDRPYIRVEYRGEDKEFVGLSFLDRSLSRF